MMNEKWEQCRDCNGTGKWNSEMCPVCDGKGQVDINKKVPGWL